MRGHQNVALGLDVGGLRVLTITRSLTSVDSIAQLASFWAGCTPCGGHVQSNDGVAVCLPEVSGLREVVKKPAASIMWSNGALHSSSKVGTDHPALFDSGAVHVTGKDDEKPYDQARENAYLAGASCADDSLAQVKSERDTGSVVESGTDDSKDNATPQRGDGLANNDALTDAGESSALILTQGTNSPRGTSSSLDLPLEREYPPDGKQSGMVSSLVSRWESEARSQNPVQGGGTVIECHGGRFPALSEPRRLG